MKFKGTYSGVGLVVRGLVLSSALLGTAFAQNSGSTAFGPSAVSTVSAVEVPSVIGRSTLVGHADPQKVLHLSISMPFGDPQGVQQYADAVSDPKSPLYRHYLEPDEVGARFGLPVATVTSMVDWAKSQGFKVTLVAKNRLNILVDATVAQAEHAFGTTINQFKVKSPNEPGRSEFFSFTSPLKMPMSLASYIVDVEGLENFTKPQPRILTQAQARGIYNTAPIFAAGMTGQGRSIGISNWDGYRLTNVPLFYTNNSLPAPAGGVGSNVHVVTIDGGSGPGAPGAEGDLDIQMVLGQAPLCDLYIYDGGAGLTNVLTREANDNVCDAISESWGWNLSASTATAAHNIHITMTTQGMTYMAASGDSGTTLEPYSYPNYDGEVLMVGGTVATATGSNLRNTEVGWAGSGGGWTTKVIAFNVRPAWQVGTGVPALNASTNYRLSPDLSLNASGSSGAFSFYLNGAFTTGYSGTSFASPVFAGMLGLAEQKIINGGGLPANGAGKRRIGRLQDIIYAQNGRTDVWYDVTSGNNGTLPTGSASSCTAKWDTVTGWGAMDMNAFVTTQLPNPVPSLTSISPNAATAAGAGFTLTVNGSNFVNGAIVRWNGANRTTTFVNAGQLTATIPSTDIATVGSANVTVFNPTPGGGTSGSLPFTINPIVVAPSAFTITQGTFISGTVSSLVNSDDSRLNVKANFVGAGRFNPQVNVSVTGTTSAPSASRIDITVEARATVSPVKMTFSAYDYVSAAWVELSSVAAAPTTDTVNTYSITVNPSRYLSGGALKVRVTGYNLNREDDLLSKFQIQTDQISWSIWP